LISLAKTFTKPILGFRFWYGVFVKKALINAQGKTRKNQIFKYKESKNGFKPSVGLLYFF